MARFPLLARTVRVLSAAAVILYVVYLVVFLTTAVALQGVAALVVAPLAADRLVAAVRHRLT
jgi:hypothetical protein